MLKLNFHLAQSALSLSLRPPGLPSQFANISLCFIEKLGKIYEFAVGVSVEREIFMHDGEQRGAEIISSYRFCLLVISLRYRLSVEWIYVNSTGIPVQGCSEYGES
jgi:hypothetical protein